jgi:hypothetical protein
MQHHTLHHKIQMLVTSRYNPAASGTAATTGTVP